MADEDYRVTSIRIPLLVLVALREAAIERANRYGGRISVSAIVAELVQRNPADLQALGQER